MRAIQLVCYYTGKSAPEVDRVRIQTVVDRLEAEFAAETNETERTSLRFRIGVLKGNHRPLRA